ncbi:hypothetical protein [Flavobacterium rhizosphaerae]|uniref:Uncharacterized protein n=1 Tax=Flavobacterium rhizosphaerae TaxID=3163298 RepID=A0ABW8YYD0_9FLAO
MKYFKILLLICFGLTLWSCEDNEAQRIADVQKAEQVNDSILKAINAHWEFNIPPASQKVADKLMGWNQWQQFISEMEQRPNNSLSGYRQKAKNLVASAEELNKDIPPFFNKPSVRSRITVLNTRVKSLYTYITIAVIPQERVIKLIGEISHDTAELERQMDEMVRLSEIPKEQGEEEMLRALDTVRLANPDAISTQNQGAAKPKSTIKNKPASPGHGAGYIETY